MTNPIARHSGLVKCDQIYIRTSKFSDKNTICIISGLVTFWIPNFGLVHFKIICQALACFVECNVPASIAVKSRHCKCVLVFIVKMMCKASHFTHFDRLMLLWLVSACRSLHTIITMTVTIFRRIIFMFDK
jgi:hypothetical protein